MSAETGRARYLYLKRNNRCVSCAERDVRTERGLLLCGECNARRAMRDAERRQRLLALGICYVCGKRPHKQGANRCEACAKKGNAAVARYQSRLRSVESVDRSVDGKEERQ